MPPDTDDVIGPLRGDIDRWGAAWNVLMMQFGDLGSLLSLEADAIAKDITDYAADVWVVVDMMLREELPNLTAEMTAFMEDN
jgi:hypothetical protein